MANHVLDIYMANHVLDIYMIFLGFDIWNKIQWRSFMLWVDQYKQEQALNYSTFNVFSW